MLPRGILVTVAALVVSGCAAKRVQADESQYAEKEKAPPKVAVSESEPRKLDGLPTETPDQPLSVGPLYYELDSAQLTPESQEALARLGEWMREHPRAKVKLSGHTCELGTEEYNLALGHRRAAGARQYLMRMGVDVSRIEVTSFGEERPASSGSSADELARNRRTEVAADADERI